jgi:uncharacterized MAPEG superfamily protein
MAQGRMSQVEDVENLQVNWQPRSWVALVNGFRNLLNLAHSNGLQQYVSGVLAFHFYAKGAKPMFSLFLQWPVLAIALAHQWGRIADAHLVASVPGMRLRRRSARSVPFRPPDILAYWGS